MNSAALPDASKLVGSGDPQQPALAISDLHVTAGTGSHARELLHGVSVVLEKGQMHGLVGETGSGKSMTAQCVMGLIPRGVAVTDGSIKLAGDELLGLSDKKLHAFRGPELGMIFQNPRTTLHPMLTVGKQMDNVLRAHMELSKSERQARILDHLDLVGIPNPSRVADAYPHELSGGMSQRVVIASSLLCDPSVVIADEPTTGLDATVQRQILDLLAGLQSELGLSVLMITHDLSIVAQYCTAVTVMYQGSVVEHGRSRDVLKNPQADYTRNLIKASALDLELIDDAEAPAVAAATPQPDYEHAIEVRDLVKTFPARGGDADVVAINSVSFTVPRGSTLGIIGESGSGKSTLVRCMLGLVEADSGSSKVLGMEAVHRTDRHKRELRRRSQIVFQEPLEALDPRMRISDAIAEPLQIHSRMRGSELAARVAELMELVMLDPTLAERFPHQLSGGQQQRVNIARALATNPEVLVLDEPTSALDVAVRSEILALLKWLQRRLDMTYVLVSHDLTTVRSVCTDVAVMYFGNLVEMGKTDDVLDRAEHAYTKHLLSSALSLDPDERPAPLASKPPVLSSGSPAQTSWSAASTGGPT